MMRQCPLSLAGEEESLLGLAGVAAWKVRADFSFEWSPAMYEMFELQPGCDLHDVLARYHPDDRNHVTRGLEETFRTGGPNSARYRIVGPGGDVRHVLSKAVRRIGVDGPEVIGVNIDVTAQLHEMGIDFEDVRRFRFIAENARDLIVRYTQEGVVTFASPAVKSLLGYEPAELIGRSITQYLDPSDHADADQALEARKDSQSDPGPREFHVVRKDGGRVWLEGNPRRASNALGETIEWVDVLRDITERKAAKAALIKALADADAATQAKSEFLANMSHELRTPLTSIIGFADLIGHDETLSPQNRRHVDHIVRASRTLLNVVNDVLDLSKLDQGALTLDPTAFDPVQLVEEAMALLAPRAMEKQLAFQVDYGAPFNGYESVWVVGDEMRLTQIVLNLLSNAVKFTDQGSVRVQVTGTPIGSDALRLALSVEDSGIGIADDQIATLFDRFTQADGSISRRFGGTGLGLAISRRLVELMGGTLDVESRVGRGSRFTATVDLAIAAAPSASDTVQAPIGGATLGQPIDVLLAEDNPANRELLAALLRDTGVRLTAVENGAEALEAVAERRFDLILMDIQMPVMDGVAATRAIRKMGGAMAYIPIIALSANVLPGQVRQYAEDGFTRHVGKPINAAELFAAMADALDDREALSA